MFLKSGKLFVRLLGSQINLQSSYCTQVMKPLFTLHPRSLFPGQSSRFFAEQDSNVPNEQKDSDSLTEDKLSNYKLSLKTQSILRKKKFKDLLPIQQDAFDPIFNQKSFLGRDVTGSGKTLAFVIPLLESLRTRKEIPRKARDGPLVLTVVPTRELALQVTH